MLNDLVTRLTLPGLPEWTGLIALLILLLLAVCLLVMPFSVFGVKGRLDSIEAQLDDLRAELRVMTARQAEPRRDTWEATPNIPEPYAPPPAPGRAEPRISWPRQP
jgi:hypothetical protein